MDWMLSCVKGGLSCPDAFVKADGSMNKVKKHHSRDEVSVSMLLVQTASSTACLEGVKDEATVMADAVPLSWLRTTRTGARSFEIPLSLLVPGFPALLLSDEDWVSSANMTGGGNGIAKGSGSVTHLAWRSALQA